MKFRSLLPSLVLATGLALPTIGSAAPQKNADVGDADSFGRRMEWIGLIQTGVVSLKGNCPAPDPDRPDDRCIEVNAAGITSEFFIDLGRMTLPKGSTDSLVCHWITPFGDFQMQNTTAARVQATMRTKALYRFESEVLQDPNLMLNGYIDVAVEMLTESQTLEPGEFRQVAPRGSRVCINGLLSKRSLMVDYGLSEFQATRFFKEPITIRGGVSIDAEHVTDGDVGFATRFIGDGK